MTAVAIVFTIFNHVHRSSLTRVYRHLLLLLVTVIKHSCIYQNYASFNKNTATDSSLVFKVLFISIHHIFSPLVEFARHNQLLHPLHVGLWNPSVVEVIC